MRWIGAVAIFLSFGMIKTALDPGAHPHRGFLLCAPKRTDDQLDCCKFRNALSRLSFAFFDFLLRLVSDEALPAPQTDDVPPAEPVLHA